MSRTRENSRTDSPCGFTTSDGQPSPHLRELFAYDGVDRSALRLSFELGHDESHHGADCRCASRHGGSNGGADFLGAWSGGQVRLELLHLSAFDRRQLGTIALLVHLDRLAALLDPAPDDFDDVIVRQLALDLD